MSEMTDRKVIEFAARAAGIRLEWDGPPDKWQPMYYEGKTYHSWNPKDDPAVSQALQVRLRLSLGFAEQQIVCGRFGIDPEPLIAVNFPEDVTQEQLEAIVRVVILAAAGKIGSMLQ